MKNLIRVPLALILAAACLGHAANSLPRATPESQGVSSGPLLDFINALDRQLDGMHSVMLVRHGNVIAEGWWTPYDPKHNHVLYSLSKSFASTAVGLAAAEGKLSIDDPVVSFFPDEVPADAGNNLKSMRVRDLLMMSTGHQDEPPTSPDKVSVQSFFAQPVPHLPGTHFKYNTAATFMQSAIVQKVTGQTALDYLQSRLFAPLGIAHPVWDTNYQGISLGGYGLRVRTEDIAKFGQLYLQKGNWQGKQLLPAEWVALASSKQTSNGSNPKSDWNQGYGFQFWRCRNNAFRGDGAFGQFCVVMPEQDAVVAITSGVKDMQAVLNLIWDKLLPALQSQSLPADTARHAQLQEKLKGLKLRPAQGSPTSSAADRALNRKFVFPANDQKIESLVLGSADSGNTLTLKLTIDGKETAVPCGYQEWRTGRAPSFGGALAQFPDEPVAGSFGWSGDDTCVIRHCAYETPFVTTLTLKFDADSVTFDSEANVAFGPTKRPQLVGRVK